MFRDSQKFLAILAAITTVVAVSAIAFLAPSLSSAAPQQGGYMVQQSAGGTISGKVLYEGKPVHPKKVTVTQDQGACGNMKEIEPVQVDQGGIVEAVVWIEDVTHGKDYSFAPPAIDQKGCMFMPHVVLMKPGQLKVTNSDNAAHNVHIFSKANRSFNQVQPAGTDPIEISLFRPDTAIVRCDVHPWMQSYVVVAQNPYYVLSGKGGLFTLTDVPAGTYHLKVWQETLGTQEQSVTVQAGQTATANFSLK
ncbi:MAG TPA: carboxypeptidase regulatory-like domain-containing protein [Candidatus Acidoferrales bacterium]|nr:carboxypeptidase regulatory-like domain-containing protein [Candidatus Acidoferrales bacterium]